MRLSLSHITSYETIHYPSYISQILFTSHIILLYKRQQQQITKQQPMQLPNQKQITQLHQIYEIQYNSVSQRIIHQPEQHRQCINCGCAIFFVVLVVVFFGVGILEMVRFGIMEGRDGRDGRDVKEGVVFGDDSHQVVYQNVWVIAGGIGISVVIGFLYIAIVKLLPHHMIFVLAFLNTLVILFLFVLGIVSNNVAMYVIMGIFLLLNSISICCLRNRLDLILVMLKTSANFITQNPSIFLTALAQLLLTSIITIFYMYSTVAISSIIEHKNYQKQSSGIESFLVGLQLMIYILFVGVMYYVMCFVIGVECGSWYYGGNGGVRVWGKWVMRGIGAIMKGTIVVGIMAIANFAFSTKRQQKREQNLNKVKKQQKKTCNIECFLQTLCKCLKTCLIQSCLFLTTLTLSTKYPQSLQQVLNHYTILTISLTGQEYTTGAKTAMGLIWKQLQMMGYINFLCNILIVWGLILTIGVPLIFGYFVVGFRNGDERTVVLSVIGVCSLLVSVVILEVIVETISCIFILYLLDKDLTLRRLIPKQRMDQQTYLTINRVSKNPYGYGSQAFQIEGDGYLKMKE